MPFILLEDGGRISLESGTGSVLLERGVATALANGRWLELRTSPAAGFVSFDTPILVPYQGEIGFTIFVTTTQLTPLAMVFTKPSGRILRVNPPSVYFSAVALGISPAQHLCYVSVARDFDEVGLWGVHLETVDGAVGIGRAAYFQVVMVQ